MASPLLRSRNAEVVDQRSSSESAALRLLAAERPEEILPILLEEMVFLGFPRGFVLEVNFETGEVHPAASLNCDKSFLPKFRTSFWASENPVVSVLQNLTPALLTSGGFKEGALYAYPRSYRSRTRCWEAERERSQDCLAVKNFQPSRKLQMQEQVCRACGMRAYAYLAVAQIGRRTTEHHLRQLRHLADRANRYLSRLFKVEHY